MDNFNYLNNVACGYSFHIKKILDSLFEPTDGLVLDDLVVKNLFFEQGNVQFVELKKFKSNNNIRHVTPRESQLLSILRSYNTNTHIAQIMGISVRTVEDHIKNIKLKLKIIGRKELIDFARINDF